MKYGDTVELVHPNGTRQTALVLHSSTQAKVDRDLKPITTDAGELIFEEHLTIVHLSEQEPKTSSGDDLRGAVVIRHGIKPHSESQPFGWAETDNSQLAKDNADLTEKLDAALADLAQINENVKYINEKSGTPSAADLDAVAADLKAAASTENDVQTPAEEGQAN